QGHVRALWPLPLLFAVWVNTHGSFVLGCVALAVYAICGIAKVRWAGVDSQPWSTAQWRQITDASLLSLLALTITPYGSRLAFYPFELAMSQPLNVAIIREWRPLEFSRWFGVMFLILLLAFVVAKVVCRVVHRLDEVALLLLAVCATALHARVLMFFVCIFA